MSPMSARLVALALLATLGAAAGEAMAQRRGGDADPRVPAVQAHSERAAQAAQRRGHDRRADYRALSDAVRRVERRTGGQVLSAERVPFDGRDVNRIKVVDGSGRVRVYMDDPTADADTPGDRPPRRASRTRRDDD